MTDDPENLQEVIAEMKIALGAVLKGKDASYKDGFVKGLALISSAISLNGSRLVEKGDLDAAVKLLPIARAVLEFYKAAKAAKEAS